MWVLVMFQFCQVAAPRSIRLAERQLMMERIYSILVVIAFDLS
jgi:hypothetical protein